LFTRAWTEIHQAPAEAEAELAYMNKEDIIDAVVTSDSDIFLFGAHTVIQKWAHLKLSFDDAIFDL